MLIYRRLQEDLGNKTQALSQSQQELILSEQRLQSLNEKYLKLSNDFDSLKNTYDTIQMTSTHEVQQFSDKLNEKNRLIQQLTSEKHHLEELVDAKMIETQSLQKKFAENELKISKLMNSLQQVDASELEVINIVKNLEVTVDHSVHHLQSLLHLHAIPNQVKGKINEEQKVDIFASPPLHTNPPLHANPPLPKVSLTLFHSSSDGLDTSLSRSKLQLKDLTNHIQHLLEYNKSLSSIIEKLAKQALENQEKYETCHYQCETLTNDVDSKSMQILELNDQMFQYHEEKKAWSQQKLDMTNTCDSYLHSTQAFRSQCYEVFNDFIHKIHTSFELHQYHHLISEYQLNDVKNMLMNSSILSTTVNTNVTNVTNGLDTSMTSNNSFVMKQSLLKKIDLNPIQHDLHHVLETYHQIIESILCDISKKHETSFSLNQSKNELMNEIHHLKVENSNLSSQCHSLSQMNDNSYHQISELKLQTSNLLKQKVEVEVELSTSLENMNELKNSYHDLELIYNEMNSKYKMLSMEYSNQSNELKIIEENYHNYSLQCQSLLIEKESLLNQLRQVTNEMQLVKLQHEHSEVDKNQVLMNEKNKLLKEKHQVENIFKQNIHFELEKLFIAFHSTFESLGIPSHGNRLNNGGSLQSQSRLVVLINHNKVVLKEVLCSASNNANNGNGGSLQFRLV